MRIYRKWVAILIVVLFTTEGFSQQLRLGSNSAANVKSAVLELQSTNQGLLFTRIADTALINTLNPPDGMVVYFTPAKRLLLRANGAWQSLASTTSIDTTNIPNFYLKVRNELSGGTGINYNNVTGVISNAGVTTLNGNTGALTMDTGYISNFYQKVRGLFGATAPITLTNGQIGITQATASTNGYLSSADWNTFNNKLSSVDTTNIANFYQKVRSEHAAGTGISYNATTGVISNAGVTSLNGSTGALTMDTTFISNFYQKVRSLFSAGTGISYNSTTGAITATGVAGNSWALVGNTVGSEKKLGTVDNYDLPFITNNTEQMRLDKTGNLAIGTSTFDGTAPEKLVVDAGNTSSYNLLVAKGSRNGYLQFNITNESGGSQASTDIVATANNGTETTNYIDLGMNGGSYNNANNILSGSNNGYLYSAGNDFIVGNSSASKDLILFTGGIATTNERMRITNVGKVGIGTTNPSEVLDLVGNFELNGALMPSGSAGTAGYILSSNGANTAPSWIVSPAASTWAFDGNSLSGVKNFGTTSNHHLPFITNNVERMRITNAGNVGIGTSNPSEVLDLVGNFELNGALMPGGSAGTAGYILSSNGANTAPSWIVSPAASTWAFDGNTLSGTKNFGTISNHHLPFITNNVERMRITNAGKIGIGTTTPSEVLELVGNLRVSGAFMPGNDAGTSGYYLQSAGAGVAPTWVASSATDWVLDGNNVSSIKNFGTTNNQSLPFITNSVERMRITNTGNVGIGTSTFDGTDPEKLLVHAGTTSSFNLINAKGTINNYLQLNIQNLSSGGSASSDVVATANDGDESTYFVDMGINSSGYSSAGVLGGAHNAYLYSTGNDFVIGNQTAAKNLILFTGGNAAANERMRIDGNGKVGIGTTSPATTLDVAGTYKLGSSGTVLNNMIKTSFSITDNNAFGLGTTKVITATVTGATTGATVILNPRSQLPTAVAIAYSYISSANTITIGFICSQTVLATSTLGSITFDVTLIQ